MGTEVKAKITVYEIDGQDKVPLGTKITLRSHWNMKGAHRGLVTISPLEKDGKPFTVAISDLRAALDSISEAK